MTFREAVDRKPADLGLKHVQVARALFGNREGITREWAVRMTSMQDRTFRQCIEDIVSSGWLPIIPDRTAGGEARYRLLGPDEVELANAASQEDHSRAVSLHKRSRGRLEAFQHMHQAGSLFVADIPEAPS